MSVLRALFINSRFYLALAGCSSLYVLGYFYPILSAFAEVAFIGLLVIATIELLLLFSSNNAVQAERLLPKRFSNGDENEVRLKGTSNLAYNSYWQIIDEIPPQFQIRDFLIQAWFKPGSTQSFTYTIRPTERGEYDFGNINLFISTKIGFFRRRVIIKAATSIPVYPSFIQMRTFEMYAISNRLTDLGIKKIRRLGHTMEFDQIRDYVAGDDIRSLNWKATARASRLMVNQYQDERSQQVINVLDLGRVMKMPFNELHLLEYAINTSLVISNIALLKDDKAGLLTFSYSGTSFLRAEKRRPHIRAIQESLYNIETNFMESDFHRLVISLRKNLSQRSLVLLYTNFENLSSMERQLPYLKMIARDHLLVTIFFENTEMSSILNMESKSVSDIYLKTIAEKFIFEKKQIVRALNQQGIQTILTPPEELSINAINKYLELKARGMI